MMGENRELWERKSSSETESSGSASSLSEKQLDEEHEALNESPVEHDQSPEVTSHATDNVNDGLTDGGVNGAMINISNNRDVPDGLRNMSEKLSAALVNVSAKEDLVKQHAKVAEEAISGWEKAENEVTSLKKQVEALTLRNSTLEDRVTHLDSALRECVRQLRQTREEQEQNIHDAVLKKTHELKSSNITLEKQLMELHSKSDVSNASSPSSIDFDMCQKVVYLEKENTVLKHELQALSEKLELRTIERNLSTQTAEMASKQHLESINKVAKLEAECRRLTNMACRASTTSSSCCVESLKDGQSNSGERTRVVEIDTTKKSGSEPDIYELRCSDSWASALIAELDQFKNEKYKQIPSGSVNIDLMDDFLEMERLAALPDTKKESLIKESVVANDCIHQESSIREEFYITNLQIDELKEKLEKVKAEKEEVKTCLMKSECVIETSQLKIREAETKLEELQRELENAYKSKQVLENELMSMQSVAKSITAKVHSLEAEVDKEKAISVEIENRYKELEGELEKKQEEKFGSITSYSEMKLKQEDLALAAGKLAECQKTIASLGNQLSSLATLEDFLIDTTSIPELSATPSLIARDRAVMLKSHSNGTYSTRRDSDSSSKNEESSPPSSTNLPKHDNSEKSINGFVNFFSQTESGLQL
ncbi:hypothetical protein VNO80_18625 [Phaseolus coccineus]|uniref:Filament-like plant protein n=1 Tax=Phaseolus coccineus TaxID=3886 RepID=A0AAN9MEH5_PHACN